MGTALFRASASVLDQKYVLKSQ